MSPADGGPSGGGAGRGRRWFRFLLLAYPARFREDMGGELVATYEARADAARGRGWIPLARVYARSLVDSIRNGIGERLHPARTWYRSRSLGRDAELVVRRLVRAPTFTLSVAGTLTLGLGAFAVVYTIVHQVLIAPLPYERPDDLYYVWRDYSEFFDLDRGWVAGTDIVTFQEAGGVIEGVAGTRWGGATLTGVTGERPSEIRLLQTTPDFLEVLGVQPLLGRGFAEGDAGEGRGRVILLTHSLWNRLGADASIVGNTLRLDGEAYTVIGVMPRAFQFAGHYSIGPPQTPEAFVPFDYELSTTSPGAGSFAAILRAREGTPPPVVVEAVNAVGAAIDERDFQGRGMKFHPVALGPDLVVEVRPALTVVGLAGLFLVLVLLVNLATLLLARAVEREKEFAVSRALGANRIALVRATLLEGGALGLLGGVGGAVAAIWATRAFVSVAPPELPRLGEVAVTGPIVLTVAAVGAVLGLLAGSVPALWATRTRLSSLLSASAVRGGGGHDRARRGMVVTQVALSLVLLSAGGLVVRSFTELLGTDPGFDPAGVLTLRVPIVDAESVADAEARHEAIERELGSIPGVVSVGAASGLPLTGGADQATIAVPGAPGNTGDPEADQPLVDQIQTRPGYLETMGLRLLEGRTFDPGRPEGPQDVVIDEQIASRFFPNGGSLGATLTMNELELRVIGVVRPARLWDVHEDGRPQIYLRNQGDYGYESLSYVLRTSGDALALAREARAAVARVDPQLAVAELRPMREIVVESLAEQRASAVLVSGFSLGALLLASMGIFGVVAGSVTRRRRELALRLALGADHARVLRQVMGEGAVLIGLGLLIGAPGVYAAGRVLDSLVVGISPTAPATIGTVAAGLLGIALFACWLPARRVTRIEPARVLRQG